MSDRCCTRCGEGDLYPRRCSQCGQRWADGACGPTHALIAEELSIGDLRCELAETCGERDGAMNNVEALEELLAEAQQKVTTLDRMRSYLATQVLGHPPEEAAGIPDKELLWRVAFWAKQGQDAARERLKESGRPLTKEELLAEFADMEQRRTEAGQ